MAKIRNNIKNKINLVCDCFCMYCAQMVCNECRAYSASHTSKETEQRRRDTVLCEVLILRWGYKNPVRHRCNIEEIKKEIQAERRKRAIGNTYIKTFKEERRK